MTVLSWIEVSAPMRMWNTSPRSTAPYQIEARAPMSTSPITAAVSATNTPSPMRGLLPRNGRMMATRQHYTQGAPGEIGQPVEHRAVAPGHERLPGLVAGAQQRGAGDRQPERGAAAGVQAQGAAE